MHGIVRALRGLWHDTDGLTSAEYALLLAPVAFAALGAFRGLSTTVANVLARSGETIAGH